MIDYTQLLKEYNLKVTPQRVAIVNELHVKGHINIDDLFSSLKGTFPSISLATIYKNINAMLENLFIAEVKIPQKKSVYELTKELHSHLVCKRCNKIEDISLDTSALLSEALDRSNFTLEEISVVFTGVCDGCNSK